jgi:DNA-binding NarL/FixJ family response regulator
MAEMMKSGLEAAGYSVDACEDVKEARRMLRREPFAVAVINVQIQGGLGLELIKKIGPPQGRSTDVAIIALGGEQPPSFVAEVLDLGATDYLRTPFAMVELAARVAAAGRWSQKIRQVDEEPAGSTTSPILGQLTQAEASVAERAARGLTNRGIAGELFVSVKAVEFHMGHVLRKLGLSNRTQLAVLLAGSPDTPPRTPTLELASPQN